MRRDAVPAAGKGAERCGKCGEARRDAGTALHILSEETRSSAEKEKEEEDGSFGDPRAVCRAAKCAERGWPELSWPPWDTAVSRQKQKGLRGKEGSRKERRMLGPRTGHGESWKVKMSRWDKSLGEEHTTRI